MLISAVVDMGLQSNRRNMSHSWAIVISTTLSDIHKSDYWLKKMNATMHKQRKLQNPLCRLWCVDKHYGVCLSVRFGVPWTTYQRFRLYWKRANPMINRYIVTETLLWKDQEICPCRVCEKDQAWLMLWSFLMFHRWPALRFKTHPGLFPPFSVHQIAKASTLTETTLKQLEDLSEMLRLMNKPNKSSKRLKANIADYTPSSLSVNLSLSELQPNQT